MGQQLDINNQQRYALQGEIKGMNGIDAYAVLCLYLWFFSLSPACYFEEKV